MDALDYWKVASICKNDESLDRDIHSFLKKGKNEKKKNSNVDLWHKKIYLVTLHVACHISYDGGANKVSILVSRDLFEVQRDVL